MARKKDAGGDVGSRRRMKDNCIVIASFELYVHRVRNRERKTKKEKRSGVGVKPSHG